jgi:murein DD-endopeptidase MepM/ murein hydrolase activator NlpD
MQEDENIALSLIGTIAFIIIICIIISSVFCKTVYDKISQKEFQIKELKKELHIVKSAMACIKEGSGGYSEAQESYTTQRLEKYNLTNYVYKYSGLGLPVSYQSYVSYKNEYGNRYRLGRNEFHAGVDIVSPFDFRVFSIYQGQVVKVGWSKIYGKFVQIKHVYKEVIVQKTGTKNYQKKIRKVKTVQLISNYTHLTETFVSEKEIVIKGQMIGMIGDTGEADGYHLHFSLWENNYSINPFINSLYKKRICLDKKYKVM